MNGAAVVYFAVQVHNIKGTLAERVEVFRQRSPEAYKRHERKLNRLVRCDKDKKTIVSLWFMCKRASLFSSAPHRAAGSDQVYWLSGSAVLMALSMVCTGVGFFWWLESNFASLSLRRWLGNFNVSAALFIMITLRTAVSHAQVCDFLLLAYSACCVLWFLGNTWPCSRMRAYFVSSSQPHNTQEGAQSFLCNSYSEFPLLLHGRLSLCDLRRIHRWHSVPLTTLQLQCGMLRKVA